MRNLGGAIGIGLVDTIVNVRPAAIGLHLSKQLQAGTRSVAAFAGLPTYLFTGHPLPVVDRWQLEFARPLVERADATIAFNEAWMLLGAFLLASLLALPLLRREDARAATPLTNARTIEPPSLRIT